MASKFDTEVTEANFEQEVLKADKLVLIDFYADWCGPCKSMAPGLEKFAEENAATVKVVKINVDDNPNLSAAFGIKSMPTLVTMKDGEPVFGVVGALPKSGIQAFVNDSLQKVSENHINNTNNKPPAPKGPSA